MGGQLVYWNVFRCLLSWMPANRTHWKYLNHKLNASCSPKVRVCYIVMSGAKTSFSEFCMGQCKHEEYIRDQILCTLLWVCKVINGQCLVAVMALKVMMMWLGARDCIFACVPNSGKTESQTTQPLHKSECINIFDTGHTYSGETYCSTI